MNFCPRANLLTLEEDPTRSTSGLLAGPLITTFWFALGYFMLGQMRQQLFGYFAHLAQLFEFVP